MGEHINIVVNGAAELSYFMRFINELKHKNRFFLSEDLTMVISNIINYAKETKKENFVKGKELYRARKYDLRQTKPFPLDEMGAPPSEKASQGRLNPVGIPYLYLANNLETAVAEVRPWIGCKLVVAKFVLKKELTAVDFSIKKCPSNIESGKNFNSAEYMWKEFITDMFSRPFDPRDDLAYLPSQYFAEMFKKEGIDGLIYESSLYEEGSNLLLFDCTDAEAVGLKEVKVENMIYGLQIR